MYEEKVKTQDLLNGLEHHKKILNKLLNRQKEYYTLIGYHEMG